MRIGKVLAVGVVCLAAVIVLAAATVAIFLFGRSRASEQQNFAPTEAQQAVSPAGNVALLSKTSGNSSFLYRKNLADGTSARLTTAREGLESEPSFSHDGKLVVYSVAESSDSKSTVWMVDADGQHPHPITGKDEDAMHPVFSPDDAKVYYGVSAFTGNHSPIVRPARHDWDVFTVPSASGEAGLATPTRITRQAFYELQSVDVVADRVKAGGDELLISTSGYPIGSILEEFALGDIGRDKTFQPHVPGEPQLSPAFGEAHFLHGGDAIIFLAATNTSGGNYDYNVFTMSEVTGGEIRQLTHVKGMTKELRVLPNGKVSFVNGGVAYLLDTVTGKVGLL